MKRIGLPLCLLTVLLLAIAVVVRSRRNSTEDVKFTVTPAALERPGSVSISWQAPATARVDVSPDRGCQHRSSYVVCTIEESTVLTLTVTDGDRRLARRVIEIPVGAR